MHRENLLAQAEELAAIEYERAKRNLASYIRAAWDVLEPKTELVWNWHHDLIAEYLQATEMGQITRLLLNVCPRSLKSTATTVCFPTWVWARGAAHKRFLCGSYAETLATKHSILRRNLVESDWYQAGYGDQFSLSQDVNRSSEFANDKTGLMKSAGINGSVTGEGGDYIIIDDPHDPKGADSDADRETTIRNFDMAWTSRLNDKKTGVIIVIMQRLHEKDLSGHIMAEQLGYEHVKIPTIARQGETIIFPLSKRTKTREIGDLVHPERDGEKEIAQARKDLGDQGFEGQHQQSPVQPGGNLFKDTMFEFGPVLQPHEYDYTFITADTSYKDGKKNDYTVFTAWGSQGPDRLDVLDVFRRKVKSSQTEELIVPFILKHAQWGFRGAMVEPKGHGIYLNQKLPEKGIPYPTEDEIKEFFRDRHGSDSKNKEQRANFAIPFLGNRKIIINENIHEKEELKAECLAFPNGTNDDFLDTVVDGIKFKFTHKVSIFDVLYSDKTA